MTVPPATWHDRMAGVSVCQSHLLSEIEDRLLAARFQNLAGVVELMILIWHAILSLRFGVFHSSLSLRQKTTSAKPFRDGQCGFLWVYSATRPFFCLYSEILLEHRIPYTPFSSMWATSFISGIELMPPRRMAHSAPTAFAKRSLSTALLPASRQL